MRWFVWLLLLPLLTPRAAQAQGPRGEGKPRNVVILIADDLGLDLGCYGNPAVRTPNLDALAKNGVRFANAYATVASCSPSRASIYTGLYTHQNGQYGLQHSPHSQQTHPWVMSLPRLLRGAGYFAGIIGKVHVGPNEVYPWLQVKTKGGNRDVAALARSAREFISDRGDRPFFLVVGFGDTHRAAKGFGNEPFVKDPKEVRYDPQKVRLPAHLPDQPEVRQELAEYYQSASRLDRGIGLMLDALRDLGVLDNTLIIFISDNGIPFPGAKTTQYAAGLHLPLIISCPTAPKGRVNQAMASYIDLAPTILDWTGVKGPASYKLPGRSLLPILAQDDPKGWDTVFGSHQFHEITMYYPMRSLRTRQYSYIVNLANHVEFPFASDLWGSKTWQGVLKRSDPMLGQRTVKDYLYRPREELYDGKKDPDELRNLAGDPAHAQTLADLRQRLRAWQSATDDPWAILYREEKRPK
jgi:N-sulfoglucosamine sulfohydrolase